MYVWNAFNISHLPGHNASESFRADMLGQFIWKYSDDRGDTWSSDHYVSKTTRNSQHKVIPPDSQGYF